MPLPFLVRPPVPEIKPLMVEFAPPSTVSVLPPRVTFVLRVKLPETALKVCAALSTTGTLNVSVLVELLTIPALLVNVPLLLPMINAPAPPLKVTPRDGIGVPTSVVNWL